jgi:hypothetical protein
MSQLKERANCAYWQANLAGLIGKLPAGLRWRLNAAI